MKALLVYQGLSNAILRKNLEAMQDRTKAQEIQLHAQSVILLSLGDEYCVRWLKKKWQLM